MNHETAVRFTDHLLPVAGLAFFGICLVVWGATELGVLL